MEFWEELALHERQEDEEEERRWAEHEAEMEWWADDEARFYSETREW